jgi:DnaJ-class molecular chaperone
MKDTCPYCHGSGMTYNENDCVVCHGTGEVVVHEEDIYDYTFDNQ